MLLENQCELLSQNKPPLLYADQAFRFPLGTNPQTIINAKSVCALRVNWNGRQLQHYFLVVPELHHAVYVGADVLTRHPAHLNTIENIAWSPFGTDDYQRPVKYKTVALRLNLNLAKM